MATYYNFVANGNNFLIREGLQYRVKSSGTVTKFNINTYKNSAESNRVDKTNYLTSNGTLQGVLREQTSITNVVVTFESSSVPEFNYVYIPQFKRYYFVNNISSIRYHLWEMNLEVDTLMTYKDAILACSAFIDRNENEFDEKIVDRKYPAREGISKSIVTIMNELFDTAHGTYCLTGLLLGTHS